DWDPLTIDVAKECVNAAYFTAISEDRIVRCGNFLSGHSHRDAVEFTNLITGNVIVLRKVTFIHLEVSRIVLDPIDTWKLGVLDLVAAECEFRPCLADRGNPAGGVPFDPYDFKGWLALKYWFFAHIVAM